jgi:prepilin peptidase CpaA
MGAGDVKLMGSVGAFLGPDMVFTALIFTAFIGGLMALYKIVIGYLMKSIVSRMRFLNRSRNNHIVALKRDFNPLKETIPYGIAIAIGTFITLTLTVLIEVSS